VPLLLIVGIAVARPPALAIRAKCFGGLGKSNIIDTNLLYKI
jgi:hypothetical protein